MHGSRKGFIKTYFKPDAYTARKVPKYGVFSGPYFSVFGLKTDI